MFAEHAEIKSVPGGSHLYDLHNPAVGPKKAYQPGGSHKPKPASSAHKGTSQSTCRRSRITLQRGDRPGKPVKKKDAILV